MNKIGKIGLGCFDQELKRKMVTTKPDTDGDVVNNPQTHYVFSNNEVEIKPTCQNCQHFNKHKSNDLGVCCRRTANLMLKCKPEYLNESIRYTMCTDTCDNWERRI